jgi:tRNA 5-methylaminomethyl-2-thiouridine biosynthesis bifunctional protein
MLDWKDGQPFSNRYGDVYFSTDSGLEETRHVFLLGNCLPERFAGLSGGENICIGETGFGTGLNFLSALRLFEQISLPDASLDFFSVEKFPLDDGELRDALALWPELAIQADALLMRWRRRVPGWNRWSFAGGRVRLTFAICDVAEALTQLPAGYVDAWFLDGFSPAKNPEMWSEVVLENISRASRKGATLASYTSAGWVRRGLQQAGFTVERTAGFGRKREMIRGQLSAAAPFKPENKAPHTALVIGGGIAGCAAAHSLAQRGIEVILIERAPKLAAAASGNPRGILHARFGAGDNPLHRFVLAAYCHALALLDEVVAVDGAVRAECGLLQLAATDAEARRIGKFSAQEWPAHLLQVVDAAKASELVGMNMVHGGLWFPGGGWVVPPQVCARLAEHPCVVQRLGCEVTALERTGSGWCASGEGFTIEAEHVVVCCGHLAKNLSQFATFTLQPVRGQISEVPATATSEQMKCVLCAEGYCAPAVAGRHVVGATTTFDDAEVDVRESDHADNLSKLRGLMPTLHQALGSLDTAQLTGRAGVRCSTSGAMPLVGEVEPGLYCSLAHGTRGLLTAGIAGEVVAAAICAQLPPLPQSLLKALAPLPRIRNAGKCDT